jgi:hypothetical protein
MSVTTRLPSDRLVPGRIRLRYFEDVLPVEIEAINARRDAASPKRKRVARLEPKVPSAETEPKVRTAESRPTIRPTNLSRYRELSPNPEKLFPPPPPGGGSPPPADPPDPRNPDHDKTRPRPVPCDATGLALSGGGIRSAAVCLGALQALNRYHVIDGIDYLSTVSGGVTTHPAWAGRGRAAWAAGSARASRMAVRALRPLRRPVSTIEQRAA